MYGVEKDVKNLKSTLIAIQATLIDAENEQQKKEMGKDWQGKLRDVVYDVEDILDTFSTQAEL